MVHPKKPHICHTLSSMLAASANFNIHYYFIIQISFSMESASFVNWFVKYAHRRKCKCFPPPELNLFTVSTFWTVRPQIQSYCLEYRAVREFSLAADNSYQFLVCINFNFKKDVEFDLMLRNQSCAWSMALIKIHISNDMHTLNEMHVFTFSDVLSVVNEWK